MTKLTFNDLVALEPRLAHLLTEARSHKPSRKFCANEAWYGYFVNVRWTTGRTGCLCRLRDRGVYFRAATSRTSFRSGAAQSTSGG